MNDAPFWLWSASEISAAIQAREVSALEVTKAHLARIEAVNPKVNAVVTLVPDQALARAEATDRALRAGRKLGPLAGVPVAHKDLALTQGIRTTFGSKLFEHYIPDEDSEVVARINKAGAITFGKTNTPEWGAGSQTFNEIFGLTRNPFDLTKTAGGSSGGAAAALAARMLPICDGSDLGGSLRNPASFCNVVGFRTSPGRVPNLPSDLPDDDMMIVGPMARTVDDCALLLSVLAGPHPRCPLSIQESGKTFTPVIKPKASGLRIAFSADFDRQIPISRLVVSQIQKNRVIFEELGCRVSDYCPDLTGGREAFHVLRAHRFAQRHGQGVQQSPEAYKATILWNVSQGLQLTRDDLTHAEQLRAALHQRMTHLFQKFDFLVTPVVQVLPFDGDIEYVTEIEGDIMANYIDWMQSCSVISLLGLPALSLPCGFSDQGLPVGIQVIGKPQADLAVLQLAKAFENQNPAWQVAPNI